jgi:hypothetical protein
MKLPKSLVDLPANIDTSIDSLHRCPHCGFRHEQFSGDHIPKVGDLSICSRCFAYAIICADLTLRVPTLAEQLTLDADPGLQVARKMVRQAWKESRKEKA